MALQAAPSPTEQSRKARRGYRIHNAAARQQRTEGQKRKMLTKKV
jgi:hypothetical protein